VCDLKVGDIVRYDLTSTGAPVRRGVITKVETKITKGWPNPRTYAVVFWFGSRERLAVDVDWLTKVEVEGV
jgi:hypothetical protein